MAKPKINWLEVKLAFVTSPEQPDLQKLADRFGVALSTVKHYSSKEKWSEERRLYIDANYRATIEKMTAHEAEVNAQHARIGRELQVKGLERLETMSIEELEPHHALRFLKVGAEVERTALGLDTPDIKRETIVRGAFAEIIRLMEKHLSPEALAEVKAFAMRHLNARAENKLKEVN